MAPGRISSLVAAFCIAASYWLVAHQVAAFPVDEKGEIKIGLRAYTAVRMGTEQTDIRITKENEADPTSRTVFRSLSFPVSTSFSVRQHRVFTEVNLKHDLTRLVREGFGPFKLLHYLPFKIRKMHYFLAYRGEYEGIYDYGPSEFRNKDQFIDPLLVPDGPFITNPPADCRNYIPDPNTPGPSVYGTGFTRCDVAGPARQRLRDVSSLRNRLFQAYLQAQVGKVTLRFGRQILAWGETDIFRLLDNINPLDSSFGGFLVSLDERRVPLDMLRATWYLGDFRRTGIPYLDILSKLPFYEAYLEGFIAIDDKVGFDPGIPNGSPWGLPNLGNPSTSTYTQRYSPSRTFSDARGGFQFRFSTPFPGIGDLMLGAAHYFTYFDTPAVQVLVQDFPFLINEDVPAQGFNAWAQQRAPRVRVSGLFGNFAIPPKWVRPLYITGEPIVRFELAYFRNEPRAAQSSMDPFYFALPAGGRQPCERGRRVNSRGERTDDGPFCTGGARTGDSWNFALGLDLQQWVRFLNPSASFFISTQFFYKHLRGAEKRRAIETPFDPYPGQPPVFLGEILPVPGQNLAPDSYGLPTGAAVPDFVHSGVDQFVQTLLVTTSYYSGRIIPSIGVFYDWNHSWTVQPGITYSRDPFRITLNYSFLSAKRLKGGLGTSLLRDRDNLLFQFEYVI